jgi:hypothetical protein
MKHKVSSTTSAPAHEIAALRQAAPADLKEHWRALYCTEPPRRISRDLLVRALAYRIQEKALGGLKPPTRRLLAKVAAAASAHRPMRVPPQRLSNREQFCYASGTAPSIRSSPARTASSSGASRTSRYQR